MYRCVALLKRGPLTSKKLAIFCFYEVTPTGVMVHPRKLPSLVPKWLFAMESFTYAF